MINFYELPAQQNYIDSHVDLPLQTMSMLAEAYKNQYEQAQLQYLNYVSTYGDFTSPIAGDVSQWNQLTVGRVQDAIKNMNDPEWLKTPEGQAAINNVIATTNYGNLAKIKQSSENAQAFLKAAQTMQAQGKLNWDWVKLAGQDPNSWDTTKNGIFNYTAPIEYKTGQELSDPYFQDLRPGIIGRKIHNGVLYNVIGNSVLNLNQIASSKFNDLINTPQGQMYYKQYKAQGMNDALAANAFKNMIVSSLMSRTMNPTEQVDPTSMAAFQSKLALRNSLAEMAAKARYDMQEEEMKAGLKAQSAKAAQMASLTNMLGFSSMQNTAKRLGVKMTPGATSDIAYKTAIGTVNTLTNPAAMKGRAWSTQAAMNVPLTVPMNGKPVKITPAQIIALHNSAQSLHNQLSKYKPGTDAYNNVTANFLDKVGKLNSLSDAYYNIGMWHHETGQSYNYPEYSKSNKNLDKYNSAVNGLFNNISSNMSGDASTTVGETLSGQSYAQSSHGWFDAKNQRFVQPENVIANMYPRTQYNPTTGLTEVKPFRTVPDQEGISQYIEGGNLPQDTKFRVTNKFANYVDSKGQLRTLVHAQVKIPYEDLKSNLQHGIGASISRKIPFFTPGTKDLLKKNYGIDVVTETDPYNKKNTKDYAIIPTTIDVSGGEIQQRLNTNYNAKKISKKYLESEIPEYQSDAYNENQ